MMFCILGIVTGWMIYPSINKSEFACPDLKVLIIQGAGAEKALLLTADSGQVEQPPSISRQCRDYKSIQKLT